jgi:YesN/AraC family two-component response regulator
MTARRTNVLVVDDEAPIRTAVRRILEREGYAVVAEASNGVDALALLDAKHIDLLVTDLDMPDGPGLEMMADVHWKRPNLKVLYVTGYPDQLFSQRKLLPETEAFLSKPFTYESLAEAVSLLVYGKLKRP